jgi:cell division septation protein DedD
MSESVNPRFAVDLNDIERQLAQAGAPQAQPASAQRNNDPLAELARIVGQDDPFQAILANDGASRPRQQGSAIDDLFATRDTVTPAPRQAQVRGQQANLDIPAFDLDSYPQAEPRQAAQAYAYQQPAASQHAAYGNEAYADEYYDEQGGAYAGQDYAQPERLDYPPVENKRSRKGMIAVAALVGAVVIGGGGAYVFSGSSAVTGGEPPLVKADNEPVKVQPQNPGGVEIPNQNKQIYERAQQNTETKVVNREEQPVDLNQAVHANGSSTVADATGATVHGGAPRQNANSLNLGEPRKVRTVTIRPDGSVSSAENAGARASGPAPVPAMTLPTEAQPTRMASAAPVAPVAQPRAAASTPAATPAPTPKPAAAASTPATTPAPQRVAAAQPVPAAASEAAETTTTATGGFSVQLGLANSEAAAESAFASYQRKYSDLEGMPSLIRKAEVNGNTIYRVRVGPLSREEASSLCSKLQGQGGQCFVAKN